MLQTNVLRDSQARKAILAMARIAAVVVCLAMALAQSSDGQQLALIPTLIALGTKKFFGRDKGDPNQALADTPAVAFVLGALTTGDVEAADDLMDPNAAAYANGYTVIDPDAGDSPAQFAENVQFWRARVPDLSIEVYDEFVQKHRHKDQDVAVRMVMSGTPLGTDARFEFEGAAFVKVVDGKTTEWRLIVDSQVAEELIASLASE